MYNIMPVSKFSFSTELEAPASQLIKLLTDYESYPNYLTGQLEDVKIIKKTQNEIITEDTIYFKTIFKTNFKIQCLHKLLNNTLQTEILTKPAQGSIIKISLEQLPSSTKVDVDIDLKLSLKVKILQPLFKKYYKRTLTSILYKLNYKILDSMSVN